MEIIERFATKCPCWSTNLKQQGLDPKDPKADSRYQQYYRLFRAKKIKLMLHSLGCARASADYQAGRWNVSTNDNAIAHACVDSNDGKTRQTLRWDMRGWHCAGSGNNTHISVEMCESDEIVYRTDKPWLFTFKNKEKALRHCRTAYKGTVELFAYLCKMFECDPMTDICSHKEGHAMGIASNHGDPEHYWTGMGLGYTMDTFRADVKAKMLEEEDMTKEQTEAAISEALAPISEQLAAIGETLSAIVETMSDMRETDSALAGGLAALKGEIDKAGEKLVHVDDIPWKGVRSAVRDLVDGGYINGGTSAEVDPDDINLGLEDVRVLAVLKRYVDDKVKGGG